VEERRPSPEEMLTRAAEEASRSHRGRLKIFFGAVPGVGKTYAMLEAARARKAHGADVVIGVVETHGRADTAALAEGIERISPRTIQYRGVELKEFDIDAVLERHPTLVLVDELAHTNAPGSRHARRWQDVVELLEAGIEVYSTLNVQHVESLNDVVSGITGVSVRETVPDSLLDLAHEIELVDLSADDLLQRLSEGKVYMPAQAERATQNFFKKGNLIALRELALRRTAERVDAQAVEWKREHGIDESWRTGERLLVAVDSSTRAKDLIRAGRRMSSRLRAPWIVMAVEDPAFERRSEETRERMAESLALAQRLGAETLVLRGEKVADEILNVARERNISRILVGKPHSPRWLQVLRGSVVDHLVRHAEGVEVLVTSGEAEGEPAERATAPPRAARASEYAWVLVPIVVCTLVCFVTREFFSLADQAMIYLLGVLIASSRLSRIPSLLVAVLSIAALDFCFVEPVGKFTFYDMRYGVTFLVMLLVAVSVSRRTVLMREQADAARERERRTASLFEMGRGLSVEDEPVAIAETVVAHVRNLFGCDAAIFMREGAAGIARLAGDASGVLSADREAAVARWVFDHGHPAGSGTDTLPGSIGLFLPLKGTHGTLGVFGVALGQRAEDLTPSQHQILETFVAQTALALERVTLSEEASKARIAAETERLRSTLLSTVSHDLRTPLASITGSAQVLLDDEGLLDAHARRELITTIHEEGDRLSRLVANLLDLTRIESGAMQVKKEWCPVDEVLHSAVGRVRARLEGRAVKVDVPEDVLQVRVDPVLLEQVLVNLLENACKYSPANSPIDLVAKPGDRAVVFEVSDRGRGIPAGEERKIFEKFYRVSDNGTPQGAGLGLAVAQAIVTAHGGTIGCENRKGGGATFRFEVPIEGEAPIEQQGAGLES
jgi:two-component system, OmpR family, sensor histidine kinase KdpD